MRRNEGERIEWQLKEFAERLKDAAGSNLRSVVLYGSAATSNFYEHFSDVNVLALLQDLSAPVMLALSETVQWWKKESQASALFLSVAEVTRAADVFAIALLEVRIQQ